MNPSYRPPGQTGQYVPECALEQHSPRIAEKICMLWGTPEVESFVAALLMDSRDGARQGFAWEVAQELLFLTDISIAKRAIVAAETTGLPYRQVYQSMRSNADAAATGSWQNPQHSNDSCIRDKPATPARATPVRRPAVRKKSFWQRLFG